MSRAVPDRAYCKACDIAISAIQLLFRCASLRPKERSRTPPSLLANSPVLATQGLHTCVLVRLIRRPSSSRRFYKRISKPGSRKRSLGCCCRIRTFRSASVNINLWTVAEAKAKLSRVIEDARSTCTTLPRPERALWCASGNSLAPWIYSKQEYIQRCPCKYQNGAIAWQSGFPPPL